MLDDVKLRDIPGFPAQGGPDWTLGKLSDRIRMVAQFDVDYRTLEKAMFRAFQGVVVPGWEFEDEEGRVKWIAESDALAARCRDAVLAYLNSIASAA